MPRTKRIAPGGLVYHVLNRGVGRRKIFASERDYLAFEQAVAETLGLYSMRILGYCWLPNHWHFVLWPEEDGQLSAFLQRLTNTHTHRWQRAKRQVGYGHLYQGRFKSFPVESDEHFYAVLRYVERNAVRARLCRTAEAWRWGSLWQRVHEPRSPLLSDWPLPKPRNWTQRVNAPQTKAELATIERSIQRGTPLGSDAWVHATARALGLTSTLRPRGRPRAEPQE